MESYRYLASVYDECMYDVDYLRWYKYIKSLLPAENGAGIIETACGTGSITRFLARDYNVVALDVSADMLRIAGEKLKADGLDAKLVCADMRDFRREKKSIAVVSAMDGVNYLIDGADGFFASAYENLLHGGVLLFDISSEYKLSSVIGDGVFFDDCDDYTYLWTNEYASPLLTMTLSMFIKQEGGQYKRYDETHVQRAYSAREITEALEKAGFCDIMCFGFLTEAPPKDDCKRLQFRAVKK